MVSSLISVLKYWAYLPLYIEILLVVLPDRVFLPAWIDDDILSCVL
jgi:hypothetical protein